MACEWVEGYFYQVSHLNGSIVGVNRGDPRQMARWTRQSVSQGNLSLTLYEYQSRTRIEDLRPVKKIKADARGHFDFGDVPRGHYMLVIDRPWDGRDIFNVEIVASTTQTSSVTIDISPNFPDCTGGHEFIVHQQ
jgi:hypothetical protein